MMLVPWKKSCDKPRQHNQKQKHHLSNKGLYSKLWFAVIMYRGESWTIKKAEHQRMILSTAVLEKILESPLDSKEIKPVNPKGNQSWIFIGRTNAEAEAPKIWPLDTKTWLTGIDPDDGKGWRQEEKKATESEMVGWHHRLNEHEFEQTQGDSEEQGSLACCSSWGCKESDMTQQLNNEQQ